MMTYLRCDYKNETARLNINIAKNDIRDLLHNTACMNAHSFYRSEVKAERQRPLYDIALTCSKYFDQRTTAKERMGTPY